jgi:hypothetical protein
VVETSQFLGKFRLPP